MSEPNAWVLRLEAQLADLASGISWPETPDLAGAAAGGLALERGRSRRPRAKVLVAAAAALVVFVSAGLAALPGGRRAVADLLGLRGVHISTGRPPPFPPTTAPSGLDLGQPVTAADASRRIGFAVRIPAVAGFDHPDGIFVAMPPPEGEVTLMYRPSPNLAASGETGVGLLITEFRATMEAGFFGKVAEPGTTIEALSVHGQPAYWLSGAPHTFFYRGPSGDIFPDTLRLAANTLVWQSGPVTLRVEGDVTKAQALGIANALP